MTLDLAMISWIWHQKHRQQKQKQTNGTTSNFKAFVHQSTQSTERKGSQRNGRKYLNHFLSKVFIYSPAVKATTHAQSCSQKLAHRHTKLPRHIPFVLFFFFFNKFIYFTYLFLAVLGLRCCARAFSGCGERGLLFFAVHRLLIVVASLIVEHGL